MEKTKILKSGLLAGLLSSVVLMSGCALTDSEGGTSIWTMLIFVAIFFALMYFVMIRPQMKKQKEHRQLIEELQKGDRVITAGGIHGVIESISEDSVTIKVESGATMRVNKGSVSLKEER